MERGALIRILRNEDGAEKWAFRFFRLEDETLGLYFMVAVEAPGYGVRGFWEGGRCRDEMREVK